MKSAILALALLGSVSAFVPSSSPRNLMRAMRAEEEAAAAEEEEVVAPPPPPPAPKPMTGGEYLMTMPGGGTVETGGSIPPLAMKIAEWGTPKTMDFFRASEIKHGRIAMWAFLGQCVALAGIHFPGMLSIQEGISFESLSQMGPIDAFFSLPVNSLAQIFGLISIFEWRDMTHTDKDGIVGNNMLGDGELKFPTYDFYGFVAKSTPDKLAEAQLKELKNGRLAMWGILSLTCAESLSGSVPPLSGFF